MSLQSRALNQEIEEFLYVLQFQGKMHREVKFSEKKKYLALEGVGMTRGAIKNADPSCQLQDSGSTCGAQAPESLSSSGSFRRN